MKGKKVISVFGTRPEIIKMYPVIKKLEKIDGIKHISCFTGQHTDLAYPIMEYFSILPDYDLAVMKKSQTLVYLTSRLLNDLKDIFEREQPQLVLVHGDTTTAFSACLTAYYMNIPVGHIEAGLRTYKKVPYPEEFNRVAIDKMSTLCFAPTANNMENLLNEKIHRSSIFVTGNTVIDTLQMTRKMDYYHYELDWVGDSKLLLFTVHRREKGLDELEEIFCAINEITYRYKDVKVLFPVHPRLKDIGLMDIVMSNEHIHCIEPLGIEDFHNLLYLCDLVVTDSGGIQEEAFFLKKPVVVLRDSTERNESVLYGSSYVVGSDKTDIINVVDRILSGKTIIDIDNKLYGDGNASERIVKIITDFLNEKDEFG